MIFSLFGTKNQTPEQKFWKWFENNQQMLFEFEKDRENIFNSLTKQMETIDENLSFEFGPVTDNGSREFVISASGIIKSFPAVEKLFEAAPDLKKWHFVKFRPRRIPMSISFGDFEVKPEEVKCQLFKDGEKVGIMMFFSDYNEKESNIYEQIGYLLLDQTIGEYDVEIKVGFIEFQSPDSKYFENAIPLSELVTRFDEQFN
ncbi:MAG: hypothetical protein KDI52_04585 [Xanthomonadales bacterium]|nr:hypothetical protein [Xanthomonadales bacterium]